MALSGSERCRTGWTGGQYSLLRVLVGAGLLALFAGGLASTLGAGEGGPRLRLGAPWLAPLAYTAGAAAAAAFALGLADRAAAAVMVAALALQLAAGGAAAGSWLPLAACLVAHWAVPPAPFGAVRARGRTDPGGGWCMPLAVWHGAWLAIAGALLSGAALVIPLVTPARSIAAGGGAAARFGLAQPGLECVPPGAAGALAAAACVAGILACVPPARRWLWPVLVLGVVACGAGSGDAIGAAAGLAFLGLACDPGWIPPRASGPHAPVLYYDGGCGLCHRAVRFVLAEDRANVVRFAPLGGEHFVAAIPEGERKALPDSLVFDRGDGVLHVRARGVLALAAALGGVWRLLAVAARIVPVVWIDRAYDGVARVRHRLFAPPPDACPILPPALRARFLS